MDWMLYFVVLILFYFVVETLLTALITKQFRLKSASVERAVVAVVCTWALDLFISFPLFFVLTPDTAFSEGVGIITAFIARSIVLKNVFRIRWAHALLVAGMIALSFELAMGVFWYLDSLI